MLLFNILPGTCCHPEQPQRARQALSVFPQPCTAHWAAALPCQPFLPPSSSSWPCSSCHVPAENGAGRKPLSYLAAATSSLISLPLTHFLLISPVSRCSFFLFPFSARSLWLPPPFILCSSTFSITFFLAALMSLMPLLHLGTAERQRCLCGTERRRLV